jgi:hypothetical protein
LWKTENMVGTAVPVRRTARSCAGEMGRWCGSLVRWLRLCEAFEAIDVNVKDSRGI